MQVTLAKLALQQSVLASTEAISLIYLGLLAHIGLLLRMQIE